MEDTNGALITKYRPKTWKDVIGQDEIVSSLRKVIAAKSSHGFLLTGPSGTGKTTLARIIAGAVGCDPRNLVEIDAVSNSGVDSMRDVTSKLAYRGMSGSPVKFIIVDECHSLSSKAIESCLKAIEEPPPHVFWAFCTTEGNKVLETIRNRCVRYDLKPVGYDTLLELLRRVIEAEGLTVVDEVVELLARKAQGSPRRALSGLAACHGCRTKEEALGLLHEVADDSPEIVDLCRLLLNTKPRWADVCERVRPWKAEGINPESIRISMSNWFTAVALNARGKENRALEILSAFEKPYATQSGMAPLLLSLGRVVFQGD